MRVSVYLLLFLVFFNAGAAMLERTGAADAMGIDPSQGNDEALEQAQKDARSPDPGNGVGATNFGMFNSLATTLESMFNALMPGAEMLKANGFPTAVVNYGFAAVPIIMGLDIIGFLRGWSLL